jgi:hypothetical protein
MIVGVPLTYFGQRERFLVLYELNPVHPGRALSVISFPDSVKI